MPLSQPVVCPVLIGRSEYRESLDRLADAVRKRHGHTVLISGEAGIGKSRLVTEFADARANEGWEVRHGACFEPDRALPYSAWLELARSRLVDASEADRSRFLAQGGAAVYHLFPGLAPAAGAPRPPDALREKHELFRALFDLLTAQSSGAPLAVVVEDVHWADEASLEFILHFARNIGDQPVLLLLTYRDDEIAESLAHVLAELDRGRLATELSLDRLTQEEAEQMVGATLGPGRMLQPAVSARVFSLTEGNPFFIEEVLRSLPGEREAEVTADAETRVAIPRSVREAVRRRSAALGPEARRLVQLAAVAGRQFDFGLLAALAGLDEGAVIALIRELIDAQLIVEESADRFQFRHALTREAIYSELLARERQGLHEVIGRTLEEIHGENVSTVAGDVGYHFFEARRFVKALEYCRLAGEGAERMWAPRAAVEHYSRALTATRELSQAPSVALLRARGRAYEAIGDFDRALGDQQLALATARLNGERQAEWQALMDLGMLWASRNYERTGDYYQEAFALAQDLGEQALLAHSLNRVGNWQVNRGMPIEGLESHKQALALFETLEDRPGIAATLDLLGMASFMGCDLVQGVEYYCQAAALLRELDDRVGLVSCLAATAMFGRSYPHEDASVPCDLTPTEALQACEEARKLAAEIGLRSGESFALWNRAPLLAAQGEYDAGIDAAMRGLRIAEEIGHDQWIVGASACLGWINLDLFCLDQAELHLRRAKHLADETRSLYWIRQSYSSLAAARAYQGDFAEADELMAAILTPDTPCHAVGERLAWLWAAELELVRGDHARSLAIIERLESATPNRNRGPKGVRLSLLEGMALAGLGRNDEAEAGLIEGRDHAAYDGNRSRLWRLEAALARLYRASGQRTEADAAAERARAVIVGMLPQIPEALHTQFLTGACAMLPELRGLLRPAGPHAESDGLTNRERSVAALVAQGLSNRAIADTLVVSERTVESHVSSILSKLRFSSRAQIAAWATERGIASAQGSHR
jgi:ATP/maltotriose-dependent transcriptional regulator MalT